MNAPARKMKSPPTLQPAAAQASFFRQAGDPFLAHQPATPFFQPANIRRKAAVEDTAVPESGGSAMPAEAREFFQSSYQADTSDLRIHTDGQATMLCRLRGSAAFTEGRHIFLDASRYAPDSEEGGQLLARQVSASFAQRSIALPGLEGQLRSAGKEEKGPDKTGKAPAGTRDQRSDGSKKKPVPGKGPHAKKEAAKGVAHKTKKARDQDGPPVKKVKPNPQKAPASPDEDPAFQRVVGQAKEGARKQKHHDGAGAKATDAQKAAPPAPGEAASKAQERKTGALDEAGKKSLPFDEEGFKRDLLQKIASVTPETLVEATEFKENNRIGEVKNAMGGKVAEEKSAAAGPVTSASVQPLQVNEADNKKALPLPGTPPGPSSPAPSARDAAPKPKQAGEISLSGQKASLDADLKANNVSEEQLAKSNEPLFQSALDEKRGAQKDADARPLQYKKEEKLVLNGATAAAHSEAGQAVAAMHATRGKNFGHVVQEQQVAKQNDLTRRAAVAKEIESRYTAVEGTVNRLLGEAEQESARLFDEGAAAARQAFEDYVDRKVSAYKRDRYSGFWGKLRWGKDKLFGMPDAVNRFYTEGRQRYIDGMDAVIGRIAHVVTGKLNEAKAAITTGKAGIDEYVQKLPNDLHDVGREAAEKIQDKFDALEQSVNDHRDQMIEGLAKKYVDGVKQLDDRISEMKEANKGLVDKAIGMLKKVYQVIKDLTHLFLSIFSRLASIIGVVLGDPGGFFDNVGRAFRLGFDNFKKNLTGYLEQGLMNWLMTSLGLSGVELPERFEASALFTFALQVMGITKEHIRERAVAVIGDRKAAMLESAGGLLARVYSEGLGVIWEMIRERITDFKEIVWEGIKSFIQTRVVEAALTFVLSLLSPVGAFVKVCMAIYDFLMMLVRFKDRIMELLDTILNAVVNIASGKVDAAAKAIESAFAKSIPVIIGFLAALLHLNDIAARVRDIITRIRNRVEKGIDWVLSKAVSLVKGAGRLLSGNKEKEVDHNNGNHKDDDTSRAVKGAIRRELSGRRISNPGEENALLNAVYEKYTGEGLKGISFQPNPEQPGMIDVIVSASLAERVAQINMGTPAGIAEITRIAHNMDLYARRTTIYVFYGAANTPFGPITQKSGEAGHAERFLRLRFPELMERIREQRRREQTPPGTPVRLHLDINRTPCDGCATSHIQEIINTAKRDHRDIPIDLSISASSVSRIAQISTERGIAALLGQGVEITPTAVWSVIYRQMQAAGVQQLEYGRKVYDLDDVRRQMAEAADVQELVDKAVNRMDKDRPVPARRGTGVT